MYYNDLKSKQVHIWRNFTIKHNIGFINLFPVFINEKNKEKKFNLIEKFFLKKDVRYNELGNKLVANYF